MNSFVAELRDAVVRNNLRILLEFIAASPSPSIVAFDFPRDLTAFISTIETANDEQVSDILFKVYLASFCKFNLLQLEPEQQQLAFQTVRTNPKMQRIQSALKAMIVGLVLIDLILIGTMISALIIHINAKVKMDPQAYISMELSLGCLLILANVMGCKLIQIEELQPIYHDARNFSLWLENVVSIIPDHETPPVNAGPSMRITP